MQMILRPRKTGCAELHRASNENDSGQRDGVWQDDGKEFPTNNIVES